MIRKLARKHLAPAALVAALAMATPALADSHVKALGPVAQPDPAALAPGLAVTYHFHIFNSVGEIPQWAESNDGTPGDPLPALDYSVGSGNVLTSGRPDGVGATISGLIRFPAAGRYVLAMQTNDGVALSIGGQRIISDPGVHADRFSQLVRVDIAEPGWYPLDLLYFEKRNTSTLQLYWAQEAAGESLRLVPAEAFAHPRK
jgi:hypothetical protein